MGCASCAACACSRQLPLSIAFRLWDSYVFDDEVCVSKRGCMLLSSDIHCPNTWLSLCVLAQMMVRSCVGLVGYWSSYLAQGSLQFCLHVRIASARRRRCLHTAAASAVSAFTRCGL